MEFYEHDDPCGSQFVLTVGDVLRECCYRVSNVQGVSVASGLIARRASSFTDVPIGGGYR